MIEIKKYILDKFEEYLHEDYSTYCTKHGVTKDEQHLVGFLIDKSLVPSTILIKYTIVQEYRRLSTENTCPKTEAVEIIASRFALSKRTVWSVLKGISTKNS